MSAPASIAFLTVSEGMVLLPAKLHRKFFYFSVKKDLFDSNWFTVQGSGAYVISHPKSV